MVMDAITGAKSAPLEERLRVFDQEVRKLYKSCKDAGYSPEKIRETALPVIHVARRGTWKIRAKRTLIVVAAICLFASMFMFQPTYYMLRIVTKKFMVNAVLPYYDWTWPFMSECMLDNPYYEPEDTSLREDECEVCADMKELKLQTNMSVEDVSKSIFDMLPILVGDAMTDWRATTDKVTFDDLIEIHKKPHMKKEENFCTLRMSAGFHQSNITAPDLMQYLDEEKTTGKKANFTAQWVTCHVDSFKEVHRLYFKPYFMPPMCEPTQHKNYILMGRKSETKTKALFLKERYAELGMWVAQVYGTFEMLIQPKKICKNTCHNIRFNLTAGQIVNIPTTMYNIAFRPASEEAVAIAVAYNYT